MRKAGQFKVGSYSTKDPGRPGSWFSPPIEESDMKQSSFRIGDECVNER